MQEYKTAISDEISHNLAIKTDQLNVINQQLNSLKALA
jgi:hypothetical protein